MSTEDPIEGLIVHACSVDRARQDVRAALDRASWFLLVWAEPAGLPEHNMVPGQTLFAGPGDALLRLLEMAITEVKERLRNAEN